MPLYDAKGNVLSSSDYAKVKPKSKVKPIIGELNTGYGDDFTGKIAALSSLNNLQYNTERLGLADYRMMRDHYQINSSLSLLTFMMHQSQFTIKCKNKKIADHCEMNIRRIWTRLIRAMAQAFWAGYSPNALQWENDDKESAVMLTKIRDLRPEDCEPIWKKVPAANPGRKAITSSGNIVPDITGEPWSKRSYTKIFDGIHQKGSPDVPTTNCVVPETLILMYDFSWKKAADLRIGDELLAFDEFGTKLTNTSRNVRKFRKSIVEANSFKPGDCLTIETKTGNPITVTGDHKFLIWREKTSYGGYRDPKTGRIVSNAPEGVEVYYRSCWKWVEAKDLKIGDKIGHFGNPSEPDNSFDAGYISGIFDGEEHLSKSGTNSITLAFAQNEGQVLDKAKSILDAHLFDYRVHENDRDTNKQVLINGGRREIARFMQIFNPVRLKPKTSDMFDGVQVRPNVSVGLAEVSGIYSSGSRPVSVIQTSTRTLITEGYLSHNCLWYSLLQQEGNMYGKKLLNAAFQPWYFSLLIHMYANRYFERFGEPAMIARAPYDDTVDVDGVDMKGNVLMQAFMRMFRSGATPVLPNSKIQSGIDNESDWEYNLEYLESTLRGADFERMLGRLDQEISLAMFTPVLVTSTGDGGGSFNLGVTHLQTYYNQLNGILSDMKDYIDPYILEPMARFNFGDDHEYVEIEFRRIGGTDPETMRAIFNTLFSNGRLEFEDIEQAGFELGLSIKEVEQVLDPANPGNAGAKPGDPDYDPAADPNNSASKKKQKDERVIRPEKPNAPKGQNKKSKTVAAALADRIAQQYESGRMEPDIGFKAKYSDWFNNELFGGFSDSALCDSSYSDLCSTVDIAFKTAREAGLERNEKEFFNGVITKHMENC